MKKQEIYLDEKVITVSEIPLIQYAELIKALEILPKKLSSLNGKTFEEIVAMLPELIAECLPDFVNIIAIATTLKKEEIEQLGLSPVVKIVLAIVEVNDYEYLFETVKKALARYQVNKGLPSQANKMTGFGGQ